jgi:hypothetical protein
VESMTMAYGIDRRHPRQIAWEYRSDVCISEGAKGQRSVSASGFHESAKECAIGKSFNRHVGRGRYGVLDLDVTMMTLSDREEGTRQGSRR